MKIDPIEELLKANVMLGNMSQSAADMLRAMIARERQKTVDDPASQEPMRACGEGRLAPAVVVPAADPPPSTQARDVSPAVGDARPEMPEMPKIRIFVAIDCYGDGLCVAEAISHHRACSAVVESFEGGPTAALRALADAIDAVADHYSIMPD